jgi:orotidine-5'-phosphate decarboxylase
VKRNPVIVALDTPHRERLRSLAETVGPHAGHLKVGLEAYTALGPEAVALARAHAPVFLDLKLHDIPNTVTGAVSAAAGLGVDLLTVHASGGPEMIAAAAKAADVRILAVTVLTSLDDEILAQVGQQPASEQVARLAALAVDAGAAGIVCAPTDLRRVRDAIGDAPLVVTPGVRPAGAEAGDQRRIATPREALDAGADHLVIGRPITRASDPVAAITDILREL